MNKQINVNTFLVANFCIVFVIVKTKLTNDMVMVAYNKDAFALNPIVQNNIRALNMLVYLYLRQGLSVEGIEFMSKEQTKVKEIREKKIGKLVVGCEISTPSLPTIINEA